MPSNPPWFFGKCSFTTWDSNKNGMVYQTWRCLTIRPQNEGKLNLMPDRSLTKVCITSPSKPIKSTIHNWRRGATPPPHTLPAAASMFFLMFTWTARFVVWFYQLHFHHNHVNPMAPWIGMRGPGLTRKNSDIFGSPSTKHMGFLRVFLLKYIAL